MFTVMMTTIAIVFVQCDSGSCISSSWVCDGDSDCPGGEDEIDCKETPANLTQVGITSFSFPPDYSFARKVQIIKTSVC